MKTDLLKKIRRNYDYSHTPLSGWKFWYRGTPLRVAMSQCLNTALVCVVKDLLGKKRAGKLFVKNLKLG